MIDLSVGAAPPLCLNSSAPVRRREHDNCQYIVRHRTTKGDPYFIYEYAAWSFLIFNKEIWFTHLFLILCQ